MYSALSPEIDILPDHSPTSQVALVLKNPPANAGDVRGVSLIPGSGRSPEEDMVTHTSILAWRIPWTEEPGGSSPWGCKESDMTEANEARSK